MKLNGPNLWTGIDEQLIPGFAVHVNLLPPVHLSPQMGECKVRALYTLMPPPASAYASISVITYGDTVNVCVASRAGGVRGGTSPARRLLLELSRQVGVTSLELSRQVVGVTSLEELSRQVGDVTGGSQQTGGCDVTGGTQQTGG